MLFHEQMDEYYLLTTKNCFKDFFMAGVLVQMVKRDIHTTSVQQSFAQDYFGYILAFLSLRSVL
jgi:hypothetical protein